jgi:hypothetical protein
MEMICITGFMVRISVLRLDIRVKSDTVHPCCSSAVGNGQVGGFTGDWHCTLFIALELTIIYKKLNEFFPVSWDLPPLKKYAGCRPQKC